MVIIINPYAKFIEGNVMKIYKYPSIEIFKVEHNICIKNSISFLENQIKEEQG